MPFGRYGDAENDIAPVALALVSSDFNYVTARPSWSAVAPRYFASQHQQLKANELQITKNRHLALSEIEIETRLQTPGSLELRRSLAPSPGVTAVAKRNATGAPLALSRN